MRENRSRTRLLFLCLASVLSVSFSLPAYAAASSPAAVEQALSRADALIAQGNFTQALDLLAPLVQDHPDVYRLALKYAYLLNQTGDYDLAEAYYEKAAALGPMEEAPLEGELSIAAARGDWGRDDIARRLLQLNPSNRSANLQLGYDFFRKDDFGQAAEFYSRALGADHADADALDGLGWTRYRQGNYAEANSDFQRALSFRPDDTSAEQGLKEARPLLLEAMPYYAWIDYKNTPQKRIGFAESVPLTIGYHDQLTATLAYTKTLIHWNSPNPDILQQEWNGSIACHPTTEWMFLGDYNHLDVNDPQTQNGKIYTGGGTYTAPFSFYPDAYGTFGGYASFSDYDGFHVGQETPRIGAGLTGLLYVELDWMHINETLTDQRFDSYAMSASVGPFHGFSLNASGYAGKKMLPIESWGLVAANTPDIYRGGWRAGATWTHDWLSIYGMYGKDNLTASASPNDIAYVDIVAAAGLVCRFKL